MLLWLAVAINSLNVPNIAYSRLTIESLVP